MMEDMQTIFAVGASAVTKLVHIKAEGDTLIERIFNPKYPYEYLSEADAFKKGESNKKSSELEQIMKFFREEYDIT